MRNQKHMHCVLAEYISTLEGLAVSHTDLFIVTLTHVWTNYM